MISSEIFFVLAAVALVFLGSVFTSIFWWLHIRRNYFIRRKSGIRLPDEGNRERTFY